MRTVFHVAKVKPAAIAVVPIISGQATGLARASTQIVRAMPVAMKPAQSDGS